MRTPHACSLCARRSRMRIKIRSLRLRQALRLPKRFEAVLCSAVHGEAVTNLTIDIATIRG